MIEYALFSWSDVQTAILRDEKAWPAGFVSAQAYWDGLLLRHTEGSGPSVEKWAEELFGSRWRGSSTQHAVRLESLVGGVERALPVKLEVAPAPRVQPRARRVFGSADTATRRDRWWERGLPALRAPVVAFHSFKGGVGRTTAALQLARLVTERGQKVLLVDMDFEAPGITWMIEESDRPPPRIAMSDVLCLLHSAPENERAATLELVAEKLKDSQWDSVLVLPAFRPHQTALDIRPSHLDLAPENRLADILGDLAFAVGAALAIVDLRAGHSDLAASMLLDSRVARALVSTTSGQSLRGTSETLKLLAGAPPSGPSSPAVTIVASKLMRGLDAEIAELQSAIESGPRETESLSRANATVRFTANLNDSGLASLPLGWDAVDVALRGSTTLDLPEADIDISFSQWADEFSPSSARVGDDAAATEDVTDLRTRLSAFAGELIHAEKSGPGPFLDTSFIRRLLNGHRTSLPQTTAIGTKGSGKTFTFLRMLERRTWQKFAEDANETTAIEGALVPVLWPANLAESARALAVSACQAAEEHRSGWLARMGESRDQGKMSFTTNTEWRDWWLARISESANEPNEKVFGVAHDPVVFLLDGLEDFLPDIRTDHREQLCLRALLQDVPTWLRGKGARCGLVVFVRDDYVASALPQNADQFRSSHKSFALRWTREESLRLVRWIAIQAGVVESESELPVALLKVWGRKLGRDASREAVTENWVLDAMSSRGGQVQARDMVRLVAESAQLSVGKAGWEDRLLAPQAIRDALTEVGQKKIEELCEEDKALKPALERFRVLASELRVPFGHQDLREIDDLKILAQLEDAGIAWSDGKEIWLVSLYRRGFGISLQPKRRERVLR